MNEAERTDVQILLRHVMDYVSFAEGNPDAIYRAHPVKRLGIVRRLVGCFYCGRACRGDVCRYCSDLPLKDPLVFRARLPLSEAERIEAQG